MWPFPGATPVLSRPYPGPLSGRRHVPKLVYAQALPILRFKKPQSPYLSRVIRDKLNDWQKMMSRVQDFSIRLDEARQEDRWDDMVRDFCGRPASHKNGENEPRWASEVVEATKDLNRKIRMEKERRARTAKEMYRIVVEERNLAEAERDQRRSEKKQAKRLARAEERVQTASSG